MKLSTPFTILCAVSTAASLVIERDLATVKKALSSVQTDIDSLDVAVKAFKSDPKPVVDGSKKLVANIKAQDTAVKGSSNLSFDDTLNLIDPVDDLKTHAKTLADDLKARKADVQKAKQCDVTREQITNINTASQSLINTIISKVPDSAKSIARDQAKGITDVLTDAQNAFSSTNCKNAA